MTKFKRYIVGGYCRDEIMGRLSKDIDIVVLAPSYDEMKQEFLFNGGEIFQEREEFFTIRGKDPKLGPIDLVLGRKDGEYHDARHPESVEVCQNIEEEMQRRDFTINAIAKDVETGEIIDPFDGRVDIENGFIQCVGDTEQRMREDIIRLLRAFKFASRFGFEISWNIQEAARNKEIVELLNKVPIERIWNEIEESFRNNTLFMLDVMRDFPYVRDVIFNRNIILTPKIINK